MSIIPAAVGIARLPLSVMVFHTLSWTSCHTAVASQPFCRDQSSVGARSCEVPQRRFQWCGKVCGYSDVGNFLNSNNLFHDFGRWLFQKLTISSFPFFPTGFGAIFRFSSSFWYVYVRSRVLEQFFEIFYFWAGG